MRWRRNHHPSHPSLVLQGATWSAPRHLARDAAEKNSYHYPFAIQARDGSVHVTYSEFTDAGKTIRHARFPVSWVSEPASRARK